MGFDDALLLVAHGSARYPDAGRLALAQLAALRRAQPARQMALGLLNGHPSVPEALASLTAPIVRIVPFFMEDGYFTRVAVPRALTRSTVPRAVTGFAVPHGLGRPNRETARQPAAGRIILCPPVGVHPDMAGLVTDTALRGCAERGLDPARVAVLVVGHGSARSPGRTLALHRHVATIRQAERFVRVDGACLEEAPFVADALRGLRGHVVGVVGFFAGEGGHVRDDLPNLIAAEQAARGSDVTLGTPPPDVPLDTPPDAPLGLPPGPWGVHNFAAVAENPLMSSIILAQANLA